MAAAVVAAGMIAGILVMYGYQRSHGEAATHAQQAELTASQVNAMEWESIATGRVPADAGAHLAQLRRSVALNFAHQHSGLANVVLRSDLNRYETAIGEELRLIGAGQIARARQLDVTRVDPTYDRLGAQLRALALADLAAVGTSHTVATASTIAIILVGVAAVAFFAFRFASARRELAAAQAEQRLLAQTSQAKSDLISVVSHDLRTPLTSIVGYLELLRGGDAGPVDAAQLRFLDIIQRNANRLLSIVNDLLFISRVQEDRFALTLRPLSLADAAAEAVQAQRPRARAREVDLRLAADPAPEVMADRARVDELIENLVSNAIKFTPPGGSVQVMVGPADRGARVEVADTGVGISPSDQEHIFERFFRSPSVIGMPGTGLGLAIVKAIADAHGAAVTVASVPGEGSAFRVDFPAAPLAGGG